MTIKESFNVTGLPTTCGVPEWRDFVSQHDAPAVARTRAAGAVLLGKTNVPPMLADWQSANPIHGRANNPWDLGRTPGGSSGGSAAAIAAGLSALEVGSDIGGSIRVPAVFCGVYGHRPSETLLPKSGQFPLPPLPNSVGVMGVQGPIARSAEDLELALSILAGPDAGEDVAWRVELPPARRDRLADFRVAVLPAIPWLAVDDEITRALQELAARLGRLGATVKEIQPDGFGDHRAHHQLYRSLSAAMTSARETAEGRQKGIAYWKQGDDEFARASLRGLEGAPGDFVVWGAQREGFRQAWRAFFRDWDVLLAPAINVLAYPHIERAWPRAGQRLPPHVRRERPGRPMRLRPRLSRPVHGGGAARHRLPGRGLPRRPAHRPPGCGPVPGGPHAAPLRRASRPRDRRLPQAAGLRRELGSGSGPDGASDVRVGSPERDSIDVDHPHLSVT